MFSRRCGIIGAVVIALFLMGYKSAGADDAEEKVRASFRKAGNATYSGAVFRMEYEKFDYCDRITYEDERLMAPPVDKKHETRYKRKIKELVADVSAMHGHAMDQRSGDMMLWVAYEDQQDSGIWYLDGVTMAYKEYTLKLTLLSKDGLTIREEEYEGAVEDTQLNVPFDHAKLEEKLRENFDDFFRKLRYSSLEAIPPEPEIDERTENKLVEEILEKVKAKDITFEED